jgi:hypothetical protein
VEDLETEVARLRDLGELNVSDKTYKQLLSISSATVDRPSEITSISILISMSWLLKEAQSRMAAEEREEYF